MMRPRAGIAVLVAASLMFTAACSRVIWERPSPGGTLYVLSTDATVDLEPARALDLPTSWLGLIGRRLTNWDVRPGQPATLVPDLATDLGRVSADGLTWTYTLKDGLRYEDGSPVTSADIKYAVERTFAPDLLGGLSYHKAILAGASGYAGPYAGDQLASIRTPDPRTIEFTLAFPYGDWPWIASMPAFVPVPRDKDDPATYGQRPLATGPYKVDTLEANSLTLTRNQYWDASTDPVRTAAPDAIVFTLGQSQASITANLISDVNEAQYAFNATPLVGADLAQINDRPTARDRLVTSDSGPLHYLALNTRRAPLNDVRLRQALQYAVDRAAVVEAQGGAQAATSAHTLITPGIPGREDYTLYPAPESGDVAKAKALLTQAGRANGLNLTLWVDTGELSVRVAEAVQQGLARVGITVIIEQLDDLELYTRATGDEVPEFDMMLSWWLPDFPSPSGNIYPLFHSSQIGGGGFNLSRFSSESVDVLIGQATAEADPATSAKLWVQADRTIMRSAPIVPLTYGRNSFLHGSKVSTMTVNTFPPFQNYLTVSLRT